MLQRQFRLPAAVRFVNSRSVSSPLAIIKIAPSNESFCRFGFTISKKVAKTAVDRNRTKRKVRAAVEQLFDQITPGNDVLVILRKNVAEEDQNHILQEVKMLLKRGGILA